MEFVPIGELSRGDKIESVLVVSLGFVFGILLVVLYTIYGK